MLDTCEIAHLSQGIVLFSLTGRLVKLHDLEGVFATIVLIDDLVDGAVCTPTYTHI